ncbi:MAG: hypothetical protein KGL39_30605 [Patescibacteria group bacterium]|nr:hypothetical protein [Patescibacteria group bacterium]
MNIRSQVVAASVSSVTGRYELGGQSRVSSLIAEYVVRNKRTGLTLKKFSNWEDAKIYQLRHPETEVQLAHGEHEKERFFPTPDGKPPTARSNEQRKEMRGAGMKQKYVFRSLQTVPPYKPMVVGEIEWNGKKLKVHAEGKDGKSAMKMVLGTPTLDDHDQRHWLKSDVEAWLNGLERTFSGAYFTAARVK